MSGPLVLVAGHRRTVESPLGTLPACVVYDAYLERLSEVATPVVVWPGHPETGPLLDLADAVVLIGGGDVEPSRFGSQAAGQAVDPPRDELETALVLGARERGLPLLGFCRGAQLLNVALGGTLREVDGHVQTAALSQPTHEVTIEQDTRLASTVSPDRIEVNSFHRWAVDRAGDGLVVTARAGDGVAEAIEAADGWYALGVQWHAELLEDGRAEALFQALTKVTARRNA
ncbi:MAG: gamma-glutamyl-gamma-aminobutyrate hydrolase family protein [Actinobacteria bacterium]|nr:gamma-glutamyl-gamma-aminobutyrate hydrolase family protein [Actinomycetota bacterium]